MRARFIHEGDACVVFGVVFARMEWVDVSHLPEDHRRKLAANPTFHVDDDEAGETPALPAQPVAPPSRRPSKRRRSR